MSDALHIVCPNCLARNRLPAERLQAAPRCGRCKQPLFQGHPAVVDDQTLPRHLEGSDIPLLVDFWAAWCAPCRMMAPVFEQLSAEFEPQVRFAKLDTEAAPVAASRYAIRSIPTLILFRGGREHSRQSGALDAGSLRRWLQSQL